MSTSDVKNWLEVHRVLQSASTDNTIGAQRCSRYGEAVVQALDGKVLADEGSYFVATNATPGTGLDTIAAPTTYDGTKAFLLLKNGNSATSGKRIYLDQLTVQCTAAGTAGTINYFAMTVDDGSVVRYTSGGSVLTAVNPNSDSAAASAAVIQAGALVTVDNTGKRLVAHGLLRTVIPVAGDIYHFNFGGKGVQSGMAQEGTTIAELVRNCPPVVLGPGQYFAFHMFRASQTAASSWQVQLGWSER